MYKIIAYVSQSKPLETRVSPLSDDSKKHLVKDILSHVRSVVCLDKLKLFVATLMEEGTFSGLPTSLKEQLKT